MNDPSMSKSQLENWFTRLQENEKLIRDKKGPRYQPDANTLSHFNAIAKDGGIDSSSACWILLRKSLDSLRSFMLKANQDGLSGEELGECLEYVNDARNYIGFLGAIINQEQLASEDNYKGHQQGVKSSPSDSMFQTLLEMSRALQRSNKPMLQAVSETPSLQRTSVGSSVNGSQSHDARH